MKKLVVILAAYLFAQPVISQPLQFNWAASYDTQCESRGCCVTMEANNNVISAGTFTNSGDFNPLPGTGAPFVTTLTAPPGSGISDMYITKVNQTNTIFFWAVHITGTGIEVPTKIVCNPNGVYVIGFFTNTITFGPGISLTSAGGTDIFVARYSLAGAYVSAIRMGAAGDDFGSSIFIEPGIAGNILIGGGFRNTVNFNPAGTFNLTAVGNVDGFFARYNSTLGFGNAWKIGGTNVDRVLGVTTDPSGAISVCGAFAGTCDFNPLNTHAGVFNMTSLGAEDAFIAHYTSGGGFLWARQLGTQDQDEGTDICTDNVNNIYYTGNFGTLGTIPSGTTNNLATSGPSVTLVNSSPFTGTSDIFITRYSSGGALGWAVGVGGDTDDVAASVDWDTVLAPAVGYVWVTGAFQGTVDFDASGGTFPLSSFSAFTTDFYMLRYRDNGTFNHADAIGNSLNDQAFGACLSSTLDKLFVTGHIRGTVDMDPDVGIANRNALPGPGSTFLASYIWTSLPARYAQQALPQPGEIKSFPNPTTGKIYFNDLLSGDFVEVYSLDGKLCHSARVNQDGTFMLDAGTLENGVYLTRVTRNEVAVSSEKIVIMK